MGMVVLGASMLLTANLFSVNETLFSLLADDEYELIFLPAENAELPIQSSTPHASLDHDDRKWSNHDSKKQLNLQSRIFGALR
jgi:hypothetical protein